MTTDSDRHPQADSTANNRARIIQERDNLVKRDGAWTAHCIHLGDGIYTFTGQSVPQADTRIRRYLQIAADMIFEPLDKIRVLDLACLEGLYGIEFALHGSNVVAIEGRPVNIAKAQFAKEVLSLRNLELVCEDVRHLSRERFGSYDVILVLGILYHLTAPDVMEFAEKIYECCDRVAIIDTQFCPEPIESFTWKGHVYWGGYFEEHRLDSSAQERLDSLWASMGNQRSFTLTRASLCNLLRQVGFTSVYECLCPYEYHNPDWPLEAKDARHVLVPNRATFVAIKGQNRRIISSPITQASPEIDRPERPEYRLSMRTSANRAGD